MEASLTVIKLFLMFFLITCSKAYENLLEDRDVVVFIEGNKATKGTEDTIDGNNSTCLEISRLNKVVTWGVDFTAVRSIYKIGVYLTSYYMRRTILSIFISNSSSLEAGYLCASTSMYSRYNESLIMERKCTKHGRFVIIQLLGGGKASELSICDVSITGCDDGKFGKNCKRNCSENCVGNSCEILEGRCLSGSCSYGWQGADCNQKCYNGTYGSQCKSRCGNCRSMDDCDHVTGYCKEGCRDGWKGGKCDEVCLGGTYGSNCENTCGKCRGVTDCDKKSGMCLNGCENGYFGEKCNSQEASTSTLNSEEDNMTIVYTLGTTLAVSIVLNIMFVAMLIQRFRITRNGEIYSKPSPVYVNMVNENRKDNQPSEGEQMDQQNVQYEALEVPSNETHYDALQ